MKDKNDTRNWNEIAPLYMPKELSNFELGKVPLDIDNKRKRYNEEYENDENEIVYNCNYCNYTGRSLSQIDFHVRHNHSNNEMEDDDMQVNSYDRYGNTTKMVSQVDVFNQVSSNKNDEK